MIWSLNESKQPGGPLIQYDETDWEFLIRLASHLGGSILADETQEQPGIFFGMPKHQRQVNWEDTIRDYGISPRYYADPTEAKKQKRDYRYYTLSRAENYYVGERVSLMGEDWIIYQKRAVFTKGELAFYYTLGTPALFYRPISYHEFLGGSRLTGQVEETKKEQVRLRLDLDGADGEAGFFYDWKPTAGNLFYVMPEPETKITLFLPDRDERKAIAADGIRTNGSGCGGYEDPQNRIFEAATRKLVQLFPTELTFSGAKEKSLPEFSLKDDQGIVYGAHKDLKITAKGNIMLEAAEIRCHAAKSIRQQAKNSSLEIHKDFNFYSPGGVDNVKTKGSLAPIKEIAETKAPKAKTTANPCYQAGYAAIGATPAFGSQGADMGDIGRTGAGSLPQLGQGAAVVAMSNAVKGVPAKDNQFIGALQTITIDTLNGGYPLPQKRQ